ncbi:MAG: hypothetical protein MHM6MM_001605 [Cercozoa sp. M6MM]
MYFDLCVADDGNLATRRAFAEMAIRLGYDGLAFETVLTGRLQKNHRSNFEAVQVEVPKESDLELQSGFLRLSDRKRRLRQFSRLTVVLRDAAQASSLSQAKQAIESYDLVAMQPTDERTFVQACQNIDCDVISLDMGAKRLFKLKFRAISAALQRGVYFEVKLAPALDEQNRVNFVANVSTLLRLTRGKQLVFSSGADAPIAMRSPHSLMALASLFGAKRNLAQTCVSDTSHSLLVRAASRRTTKQLFDARPASHQTDEWKRVPSAAKPEHERPAADVEDEPPQKKQRTSK